MSDGLNAAGSGLLGPAPDPGDPIRIGFQVWSMGVAWADLMAAGERVERMGFASLFANDHLMPVLGDADGPVIGPPGAVFEGWMVLAAWAARTSRVPLGTMVSAVGYRNVGLTVKMATALDHASGGRAMLGIGAGWHEPEIHAFGYDELTLGERMDRLAEAAHVARGMLDGEAVTSSGRWVRGDRHAQRPHAAPGADAAPRRRQRREADPSDRRGRGRYLERRGPPRGLRPQERGPRPLVHRARPRSGGDPPDGRVPPVCIRPTRAEAVEALAAILGRFGGPPGGARGWAESSPLADTEEVVAGHFRAWRAAGAEEAIVDIPVPFDDETMERLAGPVRERLA